MKSSFFCCGSDKGDRACCAFFTLIGAIVSSVGVVELADSANSQAKHTASIVFTVLGSLSLIFGIAVGYNVWRQARSAGYSPLN